VRLAAGRTRNRRPPDYASPQCLRGLGPVPECHLDLVITDIMLARQKGVKLTLMLIRGFLKARALLRGKVIALTHNPAFPSFLDAGKLFGVCRTLQIPFSPEQLLAVVRQELHAKETMSLRSIVAKIGGGVSLWRGQVCRAGQIGERGRVAPHVGHR